MNGMKMVAITDPGIVRDNNEDCVSADDKNGFAILADGMGGHLAGEVASSMAIDVIRQHIHDFIAKHPQANKDQTLDSLTDAIKLANTATHEVSRARPDCAGMGSTVVLAFFAGNKVYFGHVGDSRAYRLRGNTLTQLTQDHSVVQELLSRGLITPEEAKTSTSKNLVTRALGVDDTVVPDVREEIFEEGDLYLLCSDGLSDVLQDSAIQQQLMRHGKNLDAAAKHLVEDANRMGGPDNISVILIRTDKKFTRNGA